MKALVFGGTGWVGHHIVLEFFKHGYDVTVASRGTRSEASYAEPIPSEVRRVVVNKSDAAEMKALLAEKFEIIIDSVPSPDSIRNVFQYARGLRHYLHCSSTGGYAPLPFIPCNETARYRGAAEGDNVADAIGVGWKTKALCDAEVMSLFHTHGFPATVIRPCYITGGGDKLPLDNLGGRRETFLPDILGGKVLEVPDNGLALLQPVHVKDLARSFRLAVENRRSIGERYNICLSHALPLKEYLALNAAALDRKAVLEFVPLAELLQRHPEDPIGLRFVATHMCFSIAKARCEIGYEPEHTPEDTIVETARLCAAKLGR
ncbi:MAG: NAD-dependent epimerase/dehydratase family protein [Lentisphaeria bacterium]|nr:NAD-dependent epimerase/dehydratase family protein [Lentisphaeria bacterium]